MNAASRIQRGRWEGGRLALRGCTPGNCGAAPVNTDCPRRGRVTTDLLIDLVVPPLGQLVTGLVGLFGAAVVIGAASGQVFVATKVAGAGLLGTALYVGAGWARSHTGLSGLRDLAFAPVYVAWKLVGKPRGIETAEGVGGARRGSGESLTSSPPVPQPMHYQ